MREEQGQVEKTFAEKVAKIIERNDLDPHARENQVTILEREKQLYLQRFTDRHNKTLHKAIDEAEIEERRNITSYQSVVAYLAIGVPSLILLLISLWVTVQKILRERSDIPSNRLRVQS